MHNELSATLLINAQHIAKPASAKHITLEDKLSAAMLAVLRENWLSRDDDEMFRAAVAGVLLDVGMESEQGKQLLSVFNLLKQVSAMITAAEAGLTVSGFDTPPEDMPKLPLLGLWHKAKDTYSSEQGGKT